MIFTGRKDKGLGKKKKVQFERKKSEMDVEIRDTRIDVYKNKWNRLRKKKKKEVQFKRGKIRIKYTIGSMGVEKPKLLCTGRNKNRLKIVEFKRKKKLSSNQIN